MTLQRQAKVVKIKIIMKKAADEKPGSVADKDNIHLQADYDLILASLMIFLKKLNYAHCRNNR